MIDIFDDLFPFNTSSIRGEAIKLHPFVTFGSKRLYFKYPSITTKYIYQDEDEDDIIHTFLEPHTTNDVVVTIDRSKYFKCISKHFIHPNVGGTNGGMCLGSGWGETIMNIGFNSSIETLYFIIEDWLSNSNTKDGYYYFRNKCSINRFWEDGLRCKKCGDINNLKTNKFNLTLCSDCIIGIVIDFNKLKSLSGIQQCFYCCQYDYAFKFRNHRHVRC